MSGTLYVIATPIGNLDDLTPRALSTLRGVRWIACEDTRRTATLLSRFEIALPTISYHRFSERSRAGKILDLLRDGADVALVSDGGTPGVSDPGADLVRRASARGFRVVPVPGPSAVIAALSVSGLPADRFLFDGFLPHRAGERRRRLRALREEPRTLVLFEAPSRLRGALADLAEVFGDRQVVLCRELTKLHETVVRGSAREIETSLGGDPVRGEITLVIEGALAREGPPAAERSAGRIRAAWRAALDASEGDRRDALRKTARELGMKRSELYRSLVEIGEIGGEGGDA